MRQNDSFFPVHSRLTSPITADWIVFLWGSSTGSQINSFSPAEWFAVCLSKNPISGEDSTRAKFPAIYKCPIRVAFYMEINVQEKERRSRSEVHSSWCVLLFLFHLKSRAVLPWERESNIGIQMSQENGASLKVKSSLSLFLLFPPCMCEGQGPDSFRLKLLFVERFLIRNSKKKLLLGQHILEMLGFGLDYCFFKEKFSF